MSHSSNYIIATVHRAPFSSSNNSHDPPQATDCLIRISLVHGATDPSLELGNLKPGGCGIVNKFSELVSKPSFSDGLGWTQCDQIPPYREKRVLHLYTVDRKLLY